MVPVQLADAPRRFTLSGHHFEISPAMTARPCTAKAEANLGQPNRVIIPMTLASYASCPIVLRKSAS
jgi:hypothetical protein